ncbi:MAG: hypothetical protein KGJ90_02175 [Patescibacteria group bacterium]|nr:hypothetical protein [Patescibacteria group bacterium]
MANAKSKALRGRPIPINKKIGGMSKDTAHTIQHFGEQHPDFHSKEMNKWRKHWK